MGKHNINTDVRWSLPIATLGAVAYEDAYRLMKELRLAGME